MRDRWMACVAFGLLLLGVPAAGQASESVSEEDLRRRLQDGKAEIERFREAFAMGGERDLRRYYGELLAGSDAAWDLTQRSDGRPPLWLTERAAPEVFARLDAGARAARDFAAAGGERAGDANGLARRFLREAELLRSVAPGAPVPPVDVGFRFKLAETRAQVAEALGRLERAATEARFLWSKEFGQLRDHFIAFRTRPLLSGERPGADLRVMDIPLSELVQEYTDAFLGAERRPEGPVEFLKGERARELWRAPATPLALFRAHERWLNYQIQLRRLEALRQHREAVAAVLARLDAGLGAEGWEALAHPPRSQARRVSVQGVIVAARPLPPDVGPLRYEILVEGKSVRTERAAWGPVEVELASRRPAVSARIEHGGQIVLPSEVSVEPDGTDAFYATIRYDLSAVAPGAWTVAGRVVDRASGKPVAGAQVQLREASFTTPATGLFGPVEIPADLTSVAIQVSVTRDGKTAGAPAGATRPEGGRAFVEIPVDVPAPEPRRPTLSFGRIILDPHKPAHDVGDQVQFVLSYEVQGLGAQDRVTLERRYRVRGSSLRVPEGGGWIVDRVQAGAGAGTFSGTVGITAKFAPGRYVIDAEVAAEGLQAPPTPDAAFAVSALYAGLAAQLPSATGLLEQCKPLDAEPVLRKLLEDLGERAQPPYAELRERATATLQRVALAVAWWQQTTFTLNAARANLTGCEAGECQRLIDQVQFPPAVPAACVMAMRPRLLEVWARAQERLDAVARMEERLATGRQAVQACRFGAATAALGDPAFAGAAGCEREQNLAAQARSLAGAARKLETAGDFFQERLKAGRTALAAGRRAEAEAAARKVLEVVGQLPVQGCFAEERQLAQAILTQATGRSPVASALLTPAGPPPAPPRNLVAEAERSLDDEAAAQRERERLARQRAQEAAERAEAERARREQAERERAAQSERAERERAARAERLEREQAEQAREQAEAARRAAGEGRSRESAPSFDGLEVTGATRPAAQSGAGPAPERRVARAPDGEGARRGRELEERGRRLSLQGELATRKHEAEDLRRKLDRLEADIRNSEAMIPKYEAAIASHRARIECLKEGRIKYPRTQADCQGTWMMRTHATEIADQESFMRYNQRALAAARDTGRTSRDAARAVQDRLAQLESEMGRLRAQL